MQNLATELCVLICTFSDAKSLLRLQQTCRRWHDLISDAALWTHVEKHGHLGDVLVHGILAAGNRRAVVGTADHLNWTETWTLQKAVVSQILHRCVVCHRKTKAAVCPFTCCVVCRACTAATRRFTKIGGGSAKLKYYLTDDDLTSLPCYDQRQFGNGAVLVTWYLLKDVETVAQLKYGDEGLLAKQEKSRMRKEKLRDTLAAKWLLRKQAFMDHLEELGLSVLATEWDDNDLLCLNYLNDCYTLNTMVNEFKHQHIAQQHGYAIHGRVRRVLALQYKEDQLKNHQVETHVEHILDAACRDWVPLCACGERMIPQERVEQELTRWETSLRTRFGLPSFFADPNP